MSYSRFYNSNWYVWWHGGDNERFQNSETKDMQLLAIAHARMYEWPIYFTYRQLTEDLESCLFVLRMNIDYKARRNLSKIVKHIQEFIEDVNEEYKEK